MKAFLFGCWNAPGHYWHVPGGRHIPNAEERVIPFAKWIDTGWAPQRFKAGRHHHRHLVADPARCFVMEAPSDDERRTLSYDVEEYEQGRYLLHIRDGWTLISWWDRAQGDRRGACNSNFVLEGAHDAATMVAALRGHFPHVVANLERAGVELRPA